MGPEELAIIMSPQFINATFRAGEDWYHAMVARNQEARRRNSFEVANAELVRVNRQLLDRLRRQNDDWRRHAEGLDQRIEGLIRQVNARGAFADRICEALKKTECELKAMTTLCSEKDASIARFQADLAGVRGSLGATQEALAQERLSLTSARDEAGRTQSALLEVQKDRDRLVSERARLVRDRDQIAGDRDLFRNMLDSMDEAVSALNEGRREARREAALVTQAVEAAGMTVMYVTAQAMEAWAGQGKPSMLDNLMTSHFKAGGQPMTMREYLWFATLIKEMKSRSIPDRLIVERCPVDGIAASNGIEDFLARDVAISESKADATDGRDIYVGWFVVDGVCHPFGAESKRNCMRMMAGFIGEMAAKHAAHEKQYPELAELSPHWFSGVYTSPDIELLMSNKDIDPDKIDLFFGQAIQAYLTDPNVKISAYVAPARAVVHGADFRGGLFIAVKDDGENYEGHVSTDEDGAQAWLADHIANEVGPALGRPGLSIEEARVLMKTDACPAPVVDVLPLTVSFAMKMSTTVARLGVAA